MGYYCLPANRDRSLAKLLLLAFALLKAAPNAQAAAYDIEPGSWTLAVLPDTQLYSAYYPQTFTAQTQWIADHATSHNIKYVLHAGDITENNVTSHWINARTSMSVLDGVVPYALATGNHDYGTKGKSDNRESIFNDAAFFGPGSFYANQPSIGGFFEPGRTDNSYHTFNAGGNDWLVLALEWGPRNEVVEWANQVASAYPTHKAMLVTHAYMYNDDTIYDWASKGATQYWNPHSYPYAGNPSETINDGQQLWDKLVSKHAGFQFTFNGHVVGDGTGFRSTAGDAGNPVHQMLANYQQNYLGGGGDMRLLEFKADGKTVVVRTYSPVLDRYDFSFDQQFTLSMDELREPLTPPPLKEVLAANIVALGQTTPTQNIIGGWDVTATTLPRITVPQANRGDYQPYGNGSGFRRTNGVLLATITQFDRPDFLGRRATVEVGSNAFGDGFLTLSLTEAGDANANEVNFNASVAWFDFSVGFQAAQVNANGTIAAANGVHQNMITRTAPGRYRVKLGADATSDGLLFAIGASNHNFVVQTAPLADGSGWDLRVNDNAANFSATGRDRDFSFVYLPLETEDLRAGDYDGVTQSNVVSVGLFSMNKLSSGRYELTIPGQTPQSGMLILTVNGYETSNGVTAPADNFLAYQASPSGSFLINSYDLPTLGAEDTRFSWAFIPFTYPQKATVQSGDFNGDGFVDGGDFLAWQRSHGAAIPGSVGDCNRDGIVDARDLVIWKRRFAQNAIVASPIASNIPEPSGGVLAIVALSTACVVCARRCPCSGKTGKGRVIAIFEVRL